MADSACSATAYLCGVKGNIDTIGVDANVQVKDCEAMNNEAFHPTSVMSWAQVLCLLYHYRRISLKILVS